MAVKGGVPAAVGTPAVWPFSSQAWLSWLRSLNTLNLKLCQSETVGWSSFLDHHQSWQIFMCLSQLEYWVRLPQIFLVWGKYIWSAISETSNKNAVVLYVVNSLLKVSTWLGICFFAQKKLSPKLCGYQKSGCLREINETFFPGSLSLALKTFTEGLSGHKKS